MCPNLNSVCRIAIALLIREETEDNCNDEMFGEKMTGDLSSSYLLSAF